MLNLCHADADGVTAMDCATRNSGKLPVSLMGRYTYSSISDGAETQIAFAARKASSHGSIIMFLRIPRSSYVTRSDLRVDGAFLLGGTAQIGSFYSNFEIE